MTVFVLILMAASMYVDFPTKAPGWEVDDKLILCGKIYKQEQQSNKTILYLKDSIIVHESSEYSVGNTILILDEIQICYINSSIAAECKLYPFRELRNPGGFDEKAYYQSLGVAYRFSGKITSVDYDGSSVIGTYLTMLKHSLGAVIDKCAINESANSIIKAMVLGEKSAIDVELKDMYKTVGIYHLMSISGLHVSMIGLLVYKFFRKVGGGFLVASVISMMIMTAFCFMTGFGVSASRALIMYGITLGAYILGRTYDMKNSLAISYIIIIINNPMILMNTGFWLSFSAVFGITYVAFAFKKYFSISNGLKEKLIIGIAINIATLPVMLYFYYEIPVLSFLINLIVVPMAGVILVSGLMGSVIGMFNVVLGRLIMFPAHVVVAIYDCVCKANLSLPFAVLTVGKPDFFRVIMYCLCLILVVYLMNKNRKQRLYVVLLLLIMFSCIFHVPKPDFCVTFLDVGQGDCGVITTRDVTVVIDMGSSDETNVGQYVVIPYLKSRGIAQIDYFISSHPDADHLNGVFDLFEKGYVIKNVVIGKALKNNDGYSELLQAADISNTTVIEMEKGDCLEVGDLKITCIHPGKNANLDDNNSSIVMKCVYKEFYGVFTGDIEEAVEVGILREFEDAKLYAHRVLKVAHHGSKSSSTKAFLSGLKPTYSIISSGKNKYGHPNPETIERLKAIGSVVLCTKNSGAITMEYGNELTVRQMKS